MEDMLSPVWETVADLRPILAPRAEFNRQSFRGQVWYILQDHTTARFHRFSAVAHYLISHMDGRRNLQQLWDMTLEQWGDAAPGQTEVIQLLSQLYQKDLVICDMSVDVRNLLSRAERRQRMTRRQKLMSPLSIRFPLLDPDKFLDRTAHLVNPLFSRWGFALWALAVGIGIVLAAMHWSELTGNLADKVFSPNNIVIMVLIYPVVKLFHELGHAYAVKRWGGEVHDIGVLFLVFMPVPYVDASASSAFRDKHKRMLVGAAGIMVELVLASIAMWVWTEAQPGFLRSVAFNTMLIGGLSTLFFNGNPLLRFDGYYVFSDALEIPNLGTRSTQHLGYLVQKYLLRSKSVNSPLATPGERRWFVAYGISAFVYRLFIMIAIVSFVAGQWFFVGTLLALWAVNAMVIMPLWRKVKFLSTSAAFRENRVQASAITVAVLCGIFALFTAIPLPSYTTAEGVVWVPNSAEVRAAGDGFLTKIHEDSESEVAAGQALFQFDDPLLTARIQVLESRLAELNAKFRSQLRDEPGQAQIVRAQADTVGSQLARAQAQQGAQRLTSPHNGTLLMVDPNTMLGRFYRQGDLLAYVAVYPVHTAMAVVQQDYIGQVRRGVKKVELRFASDIDTVFPVSVVREVPASTQTLPSSALGDQAGGRIVIDPLAQNPTQAFEPFFQFEIELPTQTDSRFIGERVYLRFDHGYESLSVQLWRTVRRAFLKRFDI
jgi:putative peptide zinc metalloprotease protein